jgi:hypothetical protein
VNENAGKVVNIHVGEVHVDAPEGMTDPTEVSATGLSTAVERLQLQSGR